MTQRQLEAWPGAVAELNLVVGDALPSDVHRWDITWRDEARPGRGRDLSAVYGDGEYFAQITLDVYGHGERSVAEVNWVHSSSHEECGCDHRELHGE